MRSLKTLFLSLLLLAAPAVFAQNPTQQNSVGDITATAASCTLANSAGCVVLPLPNNNRTGVAITITGTWTGTLNFIGTNATLPFSSAVAVNPLAGGAAVTTTTGNGTWFAPILGLGVFGVDASAMSGTATVTITSSTGGSTGGGGTTGSITCIVPGGVAYENGIANSLTCTNTLEFVSGLLSVGVDNTTAGTLQLSNGSSAAHTTFGSAATTSNTILGPAVVIPNGHIPECVTSATTCTITDSTIVAANVVTTTGSPVANNLTGFSGATTISTVGTAPWQFGQDATSDIDCYGEVGCSIELFAGAGGTGAGTVFHPNNFFLTDGSVNHLTLSASGANLNLGSANVFANLTGGFFLGVDSGQAGTLTIANGSAAAHTIFGSAATTSNTILGPAVIIPNGHLLECATSGTVCTLADGGAVGSSSFSGITSGTNTAAAMVLGSGSSLTTSGTGTISSTTGFNATSNGVDSGYLSFAGNTANFALTANTAGIMGPNLATFTAYALQLSSTGPTTGQCLVIGTVASGVAPLNFNTCSTGTVTSFSAGNLSPLFTTSVATSTTTPALSFSLSNAAAGTVLGNATGSAAGPTYTATPLLGVDNSVAGTLQLANGSAAAHTIFSSGATTTNTIQGFTVVPTTGHLVDCTVTTTTCLMHDSGVVTANVVNASSPGVGIAHFAGSTQTVTSSAVNLATADVTGVLPQANSTYQVLSAQQGTDSVNCPNNTTANFATTYTIPANQIAANKLLRVTLGFALTTNGTPPSMAVNLQIGGVNVYTPLAATAGSSILGRPISVQFMLQGTAAAGASVAVQIHPLDTDTGTLVANAPFGVSTTSSPVNLATNGTLVIQPNLFCGANTAGNSMNLQQFVVEKLN